MKKLLIVEVPEDHCIDDVFKSVGWTYKEITLPSDEEICIHREFGVPIELEEGFFEGAKYVINKILNQ